MKRIEDVPPAERQLWDVETIVAMTSKSSGILIPKFLMERLGWRRGDRIALEETMGGHLVLTNLTIQRRCVD